MKLLVACVFLLIGCGTPNMEVQCSMNGFGQGECSFTNTGTGAGALCGTVDVGSTAIGKTELIQSSKFCSGQVEPSTTKRVEFTVPNVRDHCSDGEKAWNEVCDFVFRSDDPKYERKRLDELVGE